MPYLDTEGKKSWGQGNIMKYVRSRLVLIVHDTNLGVDTNVLCGCSVLLSTREQSLLIRHYVNIALICYHYYY